jgi:hypothetical protein
MCLVRVRVAGRTFTVALAHFKTIILPPAPVIFTLPHYTSTEFLFSCCESAAALQAVATIAAMSTWLKRIFRDRAPNRTRPHPARFARRPQLERAGLAFAALARHENRRYVRCPPDQQVVGQYTETRSRLQVRRAEYGTNLYSLTAPTTAS